MTAERMLASTSARFCDAGATVATLGVALAMLALAVLLFGDARHVRAWPWGLVAALGMAAAWYRFRLVFDAGVFADTAAGDDDGTVDERLAGFDAALAKLAPSGPVTARTLQERARGARRLVICAASVTAAQFAIAVVAALTP